MDYTAYKHTKIKHGLLHDKQLLNRKITINAVWEQFSKTGRIDAFTCRWKEGDDKKPHVFWDSDVVKWMEGAAYIIAKTGDKDLEEKCEWLIDQIEKNQHEDGYFNIYYTVVEPGNRFTNRHNHELYCAGHAIEAAVAYYEATGRDRFLRLMEKYVDLIYKIFVVENSAAFCTPGHEEIELALIRLFKITNNPMHLALAHHFIFARGNNKKDSHLFAVQDYPVEKKDIANGHSVRAMYLYAAVAALAKEKGDSLLKKRCNDIFTDIVRHKLYITGGIGSTHLYEGFTRDYDLPNRGAYAETCAAISLTYFCRNLLDLEKKSVYADVLEQALYNGVLSGLSLSGDAFFYENPLEINLKQNDRLIDSCEDDPQVGKGKIQHLAPTKRKVVFDCSCCPPNLNRYLEELESFLFDIEGKNAYVHLFAESVIEADGIKIETHTNYPNSGIVNIDCHGAEKLLVRIPGWCKNFECDTPYTEVNGYACFENTAAVSIDLHMEPTLVGANINVQNNIGRAALCYGPIVYCAEGMDNGENLHALYFDPVLNPKITFSDYFGLHTITVCGHRRTQTDNRLYTEYHAQYEKTKIKLIPFSGFANRGDSDMLVFLKVKD